MILPILVHGSPVLKKKGEPITENTVELQQLITNMFDTMYNASGVGLAAHQIGKAIRLFVIDGAPYGDDDPKLKDFKRAFINAQIIEYSDEAGFFSEGCLSFPDIHEDIKRPTRVRMTYLDENFVEHDDYFEGLAARIIQHEYDHIDGIVFIDRFSVLRKKLLSSRLSNMAKGRFDADYKTKIA